MSYYIFVDNSNVWIEGKFYSAVKKGYAANIYDAHEKGIQDNSWTFDFGKLLFELSGNQISSVKAAILFGSKPTDKDSLWDAMRQAGFTVQNIDRNIANKEKKIDTGIVAAILETLYTKSSSGDIFVLAMGDSDYVPVLEKLSKMNVKSVVAFWDNASGELKKSADEFLSLNSIYDKITYI